MKNTTIKAAVRKYAALVAFAVAASSIYMMPYLKYVFYDPLIQVLDITNAQAGFLLSVFSIGGMLLYVPGGIITDRFSSKLSINLSLISTALLGVLFAFTFDYTMAIIIWFAFALSSCFVFWPALMKSIRMLGGEGEQGRLYGIFYAINGLFGAGANFVFIWIYSKYPQDMRTGFFWVIIWMSLLPIIAAVLVQLFFHEKKRASESSEADSEADENRFRLSDVKLALKNPVVWMVSLIIFCGYAINSNQSYFNPYMTNVVGVSVEEAGIVAIFRSYILLLLAPLGGYLADKLFKSTLKYFMICFVMLAACFTGVIFIPSGVGTGFATFMTLLPAAISGTIYAILYSVLNECHIPIRYSATAIGIISIMGYTPDLFTNTLFGSWLDVSGSRGYTYIFLFLAALGIIGFIACMVLRHIALSQQKNHDRGPAAA